MITEPDVREAWARLGLFTTASSPAEIRAALRKEFDFWGLLIKASSFTPET